MSSTKQSEQPTIVELPAFAVIGVSYDANLPEIINTDIGRNAYQTVTGRKDEFAPPEGMWDERYKPDQEDNEIDVFVALKPE